MFSKIIIDEGDENPGSLQCTETSAENAGIVKTIIIISLSTSYNVNA